MLANTLTVTINSVAKILVRVNQDSFSSQYQLKTATESLILRIRNTTERSNGFGYDRHNVELSWLIYATATDVEKHYVVSQTFRCRTIGSDPVVLTQTVAGLATLVNAQAAAISGGES
jgi:lysozyme family protein